MTRVWRIARGRYAPLSGEGARIHGARWNSPGVTVVYTAGSLSLAIVELLVHTDPDLIPDDLVAFEIELPDSLPTRAVAAGELPPGWTDPSDFAPCRALGDAWARAADSCALRVPSAIVPEESNLLLNPLHPDAPGVRVVSQRPFAFDPRLLR